MSKWLDAWRDELLIDLGTLKSEESELEKIKQIIQKMKSATGKKLEIFSDYEGKVDFDNMIQIEVEIFIYLIPLIIIKIIL